MNKRKAIVKRDENGNVIYRKISNSNVEWWYEYDERGREILRRNNRGVEIHSEYDENGNLIR